MSFDNTSFNNHLLLIYCSAAKLPEIFEKNNSFRVLNNSEGLTTGSADLNSDGEVLVSELRDYVFDKVSRLTNGRQNPTARRENLEFDFRVW